MQALWVPIQEFEEYYHISDGGDIKSFKKKEPRVLKKENHYRGYQRIMLCKGGKRYKLFVHRIVASAFIPNPAAHPIVNHKDGDKMNNKLENLEWVDAKENSAHYQKYLKKQNDDF